MSEEPTEAVVQELRVMYARLTQILGNKPPLPILDLVRADLPRPVKATLTERQWRLLRFALERAIESMWI